MVKSRKIAMVRRETQKQRSVSFTKRRQGLFNKAAELAMLCDAQIAVLVSSPSKDKPKRKIYSFGHSSVPDVLSAFLHNSVPAVDYHVNESSICLWNEINSLETLTTPSFDDVFENSESVEELQELVQALEKLIDQAKRNPNYTCESKLKNCDAEADMKLSNVIGESSRNSKKEDMWSFTSSNEFLYEDTHLIPYVDYWPSS